ncbi:MAG: mRNA interferase RelE/StbE [Verrucomicrobiales bacterium]
MNLATQIFSREFDAVFFDLPDRLQDRIEKRIWEIGADLAGFNHHRLTGRSEFRLRVGDYRIIYEFDAEKNEIQLITLGHRRDVYR